MRARDWRMAVRGWCRRGGAVVAGVALAVSLSAGPVAAQGAEGSAAGPRDASDPAGWGRPASGASTDDGLLAAGLNNVRYTCAAQWTYNRGTPQEHILRYDAVFFPFRPDPTRTFSQIDDRASIVVTIRQFKSGEAPRHWGSKVVHYWETSGDGSTHLYRTDETATDPTTPPNSRPLAPPRLTVYFHPEGHGGQGTFSVHHHPLETTHVWQTDNLLDRIFDRGRWELLQFNVNGSCARDVL